MICWQQIKGIKKSILNLKTSWQGTQNDPIGNYFWEYLNISQRAFKDSLMQYHEKKEICLE